LEQTYVKDGDMTIKDVLDALIAKSAKTFKSVVLPDSSWVKAAIPFVSQASEV